MNSDFIHVSHLTKKYRPDGDSILSDISFSIDEGKVVSIVGKSGSGKTTLLNMLGGLDCPTSGTVSIGRSVITDMNESQLSRFRAQNVGFVFQFFNLIPELTAKENILFQTAIQKKKVDLQRLHDILELMELNGLEGRFPSQLSGGEMQRVAIARAVFAAPLLLLMDEPTGNLDEQSANTVMDLVLRMSKETGVTVLYVTHDMESAAKADVKILIRDGKCYF